jgi:hypothetical protein
VKGFAAQPEEYISRVSLFLEKSFASIQAPIAEG